MPILNGLCPYPDDSMILKNTKKLYDERLR